MPRAELVPGTRVSVRVGGVIGLKPACHDNDFPLDSGTVGIRRNLLQDGDIFEFALVWDWVHELLAQSGKASLCDCCHSDGIEEKERRECSSRKVNSWKERRRN
jgi:hypothetical protein